MSLYLIMPSGSRHGWGVCGKYLVKSLSDITDTRYITQQFTVNDIEDEIDFHFLRSKLVNGEEAAQLSRGAIRTVDGPILQAIVNQTLEPWLVKLKGSITAGYTFFETNTLQPEHVRNGIQNFDLILAGSTWCEQVLRQHGIQNAATVIQGIDPQLFNASHNEKNTFKDHFVIFSGGKFELRKGQDLVINAFKVMQDRHPDVILVNAWFNAWSQSMATMSASPYIRFEMSGTDYMQIINKALADNGIDPNRVITMQPRPNAQMAKIYKNTDIGLFPNRCEGGTNLVLMEYMACGKPVIASNSSGHRDIVNKRNALMLNCLKPMTVSTGDGQCLWDDPDVDEIVESLEWAYQHRDAIRTIGDAGGADLAEKTWQASGAAFADLLT